MDETDDLDRIADCAKDLKISESRPEETDSVVLKFHLTHLPTGTILATNGSCFMIMYHENDTAGHCSILVWVTCDGSNRLALGYERGITRPMTFELQPYSRISSNIPYLREIGLCIGERECAYIPQEKLFRHPRYLETISKLVHILPIAHLSNNCTYACKHKYQPALFPSPRSSGFYDVKEYYRELAKVENPLAIGLREVRPVASACIDVVAVFVSLLHEDLFINAQPSDLNAGVVRELKPILEYEPRIDTARMFAPNSEIFDLYDRNQYSVTNAKVIGHRPTEYHIFFYPYLAALIGFIFIFLAIRPISYLVFGGGGKRTEMLLNFGNRLVGS